MLSSPPPPSYFDVTFPACLCLFPPRSSSVGRRSSSSSSHPFLLLLQLLLCCTYVTVRIKQLGHRHRRSRQSFARSKKQATHKTRRRKTKRSYCVYCTCIVLLHVIIFHERKEQVNSISATATKFCNNIEFQHQQHTRLIIIKKQRPKKVREERKGRYCTYLQYNSSRYSTVERKRKRERVALEVKMGHAIARERTAALQ